MSSLLIKNIDAIVTCDGADSMPLGSDLLCVDGIIRKIGPSLENDPEFAQLSVDRVIDASGMIAYPGLINAHHHLYQVFSRNLPEVQNLELFDWLVALYEVWKNLTEETERLASLTAMGELVKNGCTTIFDHHYVFPANGGDLLEAQWQAAQELGVRMHFSR